MATIKTVQFQRAVYRIQRAREILQSSLFFENGGAIPPATAVIPRYLSVEYSDSEIVWATFDATLKLAAHSLEISETSRTHALVFDLDSLATFRPVFIIKRWIKETEANR